jgi:hypothetical protein
MENQDGFSHRSFQLGVKPSIYCNCRGLAITALLRKGSICGGPSPLDETDGNAWDIVRE